MGRYFEFSSKLVVSQPASALCIENKTKTYASWITVAVSKGGRVPENMLFSRCLQILALN